jgi:hypothetical protein
MGTVSSQIVFPNDSNDSGASWGAVILLARSWLRPCHSPLLRWGWLFLSLAMGECWRISFGDCLDRYYLACSDAIHRLLVWSTSNICMK